MAAQLGQTWRAKYESRQQRHFDQARWAYRWVDGIYSNLRAEQQRQCALVIIGVNARGESAAGSRGWPTGIDAKLAGEIDKSSSPWPDSPKLAIGDGAMDFWAALDKFFLTTRQQCCWFPKMGNELNALPKKVHPKTKQAMHEIWQAPT